MPRMISLRRFALLTTALGSTGLLGCVERTISITSEPEGALVYLNDEEVGRTPVSVPFTFYGVYDVRLEHEAEWVSLSEAAARYGVSERQIQDWIDQERLRTRETEEGERVELAYGAVWTSKEAKAPWWEAPGPDLVAEAVPRGKAEQKWHFRMYPEPPESDEAVVDRARQMRATLAPRGTTRPAGE
jgi:hypothetical protein